MFKIVIGSDRVGYNLKTYLIKVLIERGFRVEDCGPFEAKSVHYPLIALMIARKVVAEKNTFGVLVCSTGVGMSIAANKVRGARAANCTSTHLAVQSRAHNDANILCLGSSITKPSNALRIVENFINAAFEGGKHMVRVQMLNEGIHECR